MDEGVLMIYKVFKKMLKKRPKLGPSERDSEVFRGKRDVYLASAFRGRFWRCNNV